MAYYKQITQRGTGASNPIPLDQYLASPPLVAVKVSGAVNYTVQHTFDSPWVVGGLTTATWYNHGNSVLVSATGNAEDNFIAAPTAVRIVNHATTSGETTLTIIQTGGFPT